MTSVRALGKRRGEWEGKEKNFKEGEQSVRFEDEPRPRAPGTESRASLAFAAEARHYLGLHSQALAPSRQWV